MNFFLGKTILSFLNLYHHNRWWQGNFISQKNERVNRLRLDYTYEIGDRVLLNRDILQSKLNPKRDGPYVIKKFIQTA